MAKYHKRYFDQIEEIVAENKDRLEAEKVAVDRAAREEQMVDLSR